VTLDLTNSSRFPARDPVSGVFIVDDRGRRYPPVPNSSDRALTAELQPGQTATTRRIFTLPANASGTGFLGQRGGGPPLCCLLIGGNCWHAAQPVPPVVIE
jgi:hypothetical protein